MPIRSAFDSQRINISLITMIIIWHIGAGMNFEVIVSRIPSLNAVAQILIKTVLLQNGLNKAFFSYKTIWAVLIKN